MRAEKQYIGREYVERLNRSPFFILVDYQGLTVIHFTELRKRLAQVGAEIHVVKNSIFRIAAKEAGIGDLEASGLVGQLAVATGQQDAAATAKVIKNFQAEFDKPQFRLGFMDSRQVDAEELGILADLPPMDILRGQLLGVIQAPATKLARVLSEPAAQLARVLKAKSEAG